ncbi:MAG: hypothetical protein LUF87_01240 [Alistipes sp.]|nr:hypothetical protein [Alistipes sp.]
MKRVLAQAAVLFLFANMLHAQPGEPPRQKSAEEMAEEKTALVAEKLGLDDKQSKKVYKLYLAQSKELLGSAQANRAQMGMERGGGPGGGGMRGGGPAGGGPGGGGMRGGGPAGGRPGGGGPGGPEIRDGQPSEGRPERMGPQPIEESEKSIRKREKKMKKILTAEQFGQWQAMEKEMRYERLREDFLKPDSQQ